MSEAKDTDEKQDEKPAKKGKDSADDFTTPRQNQGSDPV